jgi:hypothetical protein
MGPKKAAEPAAIEPKEGANVCYARIKLVKEDEYVEVILNTNSRLDIILDSAKTQLLHNVGKLMATPEPQPPAPVPVPEPVEGEEAAPVESEHAGDQAADPVAEWKLLMERLQAIYDSLQAVTVNALELHDGENTAGLGARLAENGREVLGPSRKYSIGTMDGEDFKDF